MGHVAQDILDDVARHVGVFLFATDQERVEVKIHQLGVVIEHLFEMRDEPLGIDRIAGKAATELVIHPARRHFVARVEHHLDRFLIIQPDADPENEGRLAGAGEFGRAAETAIVRIILGFELGGRVVENGRR